MPTATQEKLLYVQKARTSDARKCTGVVKRDFNEGLIWIGRSGNGEYIGVDRREDTRIRIVVNNMDTDVEGGSICFASKVSE